jgi:hypothetical protein
MGGSALITQVSDMVVGAGHYQQQQYLAGQYQMCDLLNRVLLRLMHYTKMMHPIQFTHTVGSAAMLDMLYSLAGIKHGMTATQQQQVLWHPSSVALLRNIQSTSRILAASVPFLLQQHRNLSQEMCHSLLVSLGQLELGNHPATSATLTAIARYLDHSGSEPPASDPPAFLPAVRHQGAGQEEAAGSLPAERAATSQGLFFSSSCSLLRSLLQGDEAGSDVLSAQQVVDLVQGAVSADHVVGAHLPAAALAVLPEHVLHDEATHNVTAGRRRTGQTDQALRVEWLVTLLEALHQLVPTSSTPPVLSRFDVQPYSTPTPLQDVTARSMQAWVQACSAQLGSASPALLLRLLKVCAQLQQAQQSADRDSDSDALCPLFLAAAQSLQPHISSLTLHQLAQVAVHVSSAPVQEVSYWQQDQQQQQGSSLLPLSGGKSAVTVDDGNGGALQQLTSFFDSVATQIHGRLHELYTMPAHEVSLTSSLRYA